MAKSCCPLVSALRKIICSEEDHTKLPSDEIAKILSNVTLTPEIEKKYVHFDAHRYTRNLVVLDKHFSLLIICWGKKQETPIHDHGKVGVRSWVRVLSGKLCCSYGYESQDPDAIKTISMTPCSDVVVFDDSLGLHRTGNYCSESETISMHLYCPPYVECRFRKTPDLNCCTSTTSAVPDGSIPVVNCAQDFVREEEELNLVSSMKSRPLYSNFNQLVELLRSEIDVTDEGKHSPVLIEHIKSILRLMQFNPKEWRQYAKFTAGHYTRNLVGFDAKFTILLLCWERGQMSPIHDHAGSNCWVKVLEGELEETVYDINPDGESVTERSCTRYQPPGVTYICDQLGVHKMGNPNSDRVAISLHIYSPAYNLCSIFDPTCNQRRQVSLTKLYTSFPFMEKQLPLLESNPVYTSLQSVVHSLTHALRNDGADSEQLRKILSATHLSPAEWQQYIHFDPVRYTRNLLALTPEFSLLLLCWSPNQRTPIHQHSTSTSATICVLEGALQIVQYREDEFGQIIQADSEPILLTNSAAVFESSTLGLHQTLNASSHHTISLHLYTPPEIECQFKANTGEIRSLPVSYCAKQSNQGQRPSEIHCQYRRNAYLSLNSFTEILRNQFDKEVRCPNALLSILSNAQFHPEEWREFAVQCSTHYTRNLVAINDYFAIYLNCYDAGQASPVHDHNSSKCWMKVLEGEVLDTMYKFCGPKFVQTKAIVLSTDAVKYLDENTIHKVENNTENRVYTLQIYSPPFSECQCYTLTGEIQKAVCDHHIHVPDRLTLTSSK